MPNSRDHARAEIVRAAAGDAHSRLDVFTEEQLATAATIPPEDGAALFFMAQLFEFLIDDGDPRTFAARAGIAGQGAAVAQLAQTLPPELLAAAKR